MCKKLKESSITHSHILDVRHLQPQTQNPAQASVRYMRFGTPVKIDHLELGRCVSGRWVPQVPCNPAHLIVQCLEGGKWRTVKDFQLDPDIETTGSQLNQDMEMEQMEEYFAKVLQKAPHILKLDGVETKCLKVVCDLEHPVWPSHGECNGGPYNVPFSILEPLTAHGKVLSGNSSEIPYFPQLKQQKIAPEAPKGIKVENRPDQIRFVGDYFSIGFSPLRPVITHLGWDVLGKFSEKNRLHLHWPTYAMSGPVLRTPDVDIWPRMWTGQFSVEGNRVTYSNLHCAVEGITIDAAFTIENDGIKLELSQNCQTDIPVLESEAWRFCWNATIGNTSIAGIPTLRQGRSGDVKLPVMLATDGEGCMSWKKVHGDDVRMQVETYRQMYLPWYALMSGLAFDKSCGDDATGLLPEGKRSGCFEVRLDNLQPDCNDDSAVVSDAIKRHWATTFACFRSEYRGFSNNSISTNCHVNQGPPIDIAVHTKQPENGPDPIELAKFTIEKAILDGGGYGYHRNLYLDSDPILVSGVGKIYQHRPEIKWLKKLEPGLLEAVARITDTIGPEGLALCRDLSGNSGSFRWSCNAMDVVGFGHMDAYVNAWTYRALRNASAILDALGHKDKAGQSKELANGIKSAYADYLLNPETGWVSGWRSRDGQLHDYAFIWVNGVACAFGLLEPDQAKKAMLGLEQLRKKVAPDTVDMGMPCNLLPISYQDHMLPQVQSQSNPTFETYTDGGLSGSAATYYLRALSIYGLKEQAEIITSQLEQGYAEGYFSGGIGHGCEFRSWEGIPTGYEGTLIVCFGPMYPIAVERGLIKPDNPEWWPNNG